MEQVTQADREAAFDSDTKMAVTTKRAEVLAGEWDNDPLVQAFARHRIEATQAKDEEIARLKSALLAILGPLAEMPDNPNVKDDTCIPMDIYMGEIRQGWAALKDKSNA